MWKVDLHSHTIHSHDAFAPVDAIIRTCVRRGIDCLAVTDHNRVDGAVRLSALAPFQVIIGEEIRTTEGEIIGLFLRERIPPLLSPEETIVEIRRQRGVVYIPHPFSEGRRESRFPRRRLEEIVQEVDVVEVLNPRNRDPSLDERARELARTAGRLAGAGSDAHTTFELGNAYVEMEPFDDPARFLKSLANGRIRGRRTPLWWRAIANHRVRKAARALVPAPRSSS
ncbi:MAG: PHP domain-containing protein [Gemmatimonadota bacterium]